MIKKTNAVRILERLDISFSLKEFKIDQFDLSAERAAELMEVPLERVFKTLVARGDKNGVIVASIPGGDQLDLKALAKISANKKVEMVPLKEVEKLTGYIRGSVSPLGIKHHYPFYLDSSYSGYATIIISAGMPGLQVEINPHELAAATGALIGNIAK